MNLYEKAHFFDAIEPLRVATCLEFGYVPTLVHPRWHITLSRPDLPPPEGETYDLVFFDGMPDYRSMKAVYAKYAPRATKVIAVRHIVGMHGWRGVAKVWTELAYETRVDQGEELFLREGFYETIEPNERCEGIGWFYV